MTPNAMRDVSHTLLVDLYELTMAVAYWREGMAERPATFSLFVRGLPPGRGYLVAAGLDDALRWLEGARFSDDDLVALRRLGLFDDDAMRWLGWLRFTGSVRAVPEGSVVFADEPLLEVDAPIAEAQLAETFLLNQLTLQTTLATKAARLRHAAGGRAVVDFALRRAQGIDAGMKLARVARLVGLDGTSNIAGSARYGLAASGTMAHAFVQAYRDETDAFRAFARTYGDRTVLLVDTYDTPRGVDRAVQVARELRDKGVEIRGIRLDSGDLAALARLARRRLDEEGFPEVQVLASGGLDEYEIQRLVGEEQAPIDGFGVGSSLGVSDDAPTLDSVYKLVAYDGRPVCKTSTGKATWPGPKQVWRAGDWSGDQLGLADEPAPGAGWRPLLVEVMRHGRRTDDGRRTLGEAHDHFEREWQALPDGVRELRHPDPYPVEPTSRLGQVTAEVDVDLEAAGVAAPKGAEMDENVAFDSETCLVVVDVQNDFADRSGGLYVEGGEQIVPAVNDLVVAAFEAGATVVYTQDWHPESTPHFDKDGGVWPVHCVAGSWGAGLHPGLRIAGTVIKKGTGGEDGYSGFTAREPTTGEERPTGLDALLRDREVTRVVVCGLALDVCVKETVLDARRLDYDTVVVVAATRPVNLQPDDGKRALETMAAAGAIIA